jgi:hypothetical protein
MYLRFFGGAEFGQGSKVVPKDGQAELGAGSRETMTLKATQIPVFFAPPIKVSKSLQGMVTLVAVPCLVVPQCVRSLALRLGSVGG